MSDSYSISEARNHLPAIVHDVENGKPIELTRRGATVAVLVSAAEYQRFAKGRPDFWKFLKAFRRRTDLAELNIAEVFKGTRDRSPGRVVKW